jgi:hypothetical protein
MVREDANILEPERDTGLSHDAVKTRLGSRRMIYWRPLKYHLLKVRVGGSQSRWRGPVRIGFGSARQLIKF